MTDAKAHAPVKDQIVLITGASSGMGAATAIHLARSGYHVALLARREDRLQRVAQQCKEANAEIKTLVVPVDVSDKGKLKAAVDKTVEELGPINFLFANAGIYSRSPTAEADLDKWHQVIEVNLVSQMNITRFVLGSMLPLAKEGKQVGIVFLASVASKLSFFGSGAYSASKHGLLGFANSLFEEVSSLEPGYVNTEMVAGSSQLDPEKMIQSEDIAATVQWVMECPATMCPTEIYIRPQKSPYKK